MGTLYGVSSNSSRVGRAAEARSQRWQSTIVGTDNCQIKMLKTLWATVHNGKVELLETADLPEGTKVLVTVLPGDDETEFWSQASQPTLDTVWDNTEDDVYGQLLEA
jgi:hypothetical protein